MAGERTFLQVPPDSTGKRVRMTHTAEIFYNSLSPSSYSWQIGQMYTTTFDDDAVYTIHVHGVHQITSTTGILEVHYQKAAKYDNLSPKVGANIIAENGSTVAVVQSSRDIYLNSNALIGYDNPEYGANIDATGSMNIRFSEGLPQLDAFGKLRTSGATILGDYVFANTILPQYFTTTKWGGASVTHNTSRRALVLTTPDTTSGVATTDPNTGTMSDLTAKSITHTTDTYHHYFPGFSHSIVMTVALDNDSTVAGLAQKWGYFDDKNGYYFQSIDERGLEFVVRSSASGNLIETIISSSDTKIYVNNVLSETFAGAGWNGDPVDGTGDSGKEFDLTDDNIYWIDIQWLGAGRVRFGTYSEGQRVVIHEHYNDVNNGYPHSQSGSLPLRYQQYCMAGEVVSSTHSMYAWCASIISEAAVDLTMQGFGQVESFEVTFDPSNLNDYEGLNDIGMGDRLGVIKNSVSSSGTTLTVPNVTDIKPGFVLSVVGGTGTVAENTTVLEIINSTTIKLNKAPTIDLSSASVRFSLNVDKEYHLIGILSPKKYIGTQTSVKNRTIYQPKSMQAWAYHDDGADAFCEVEVYVQPVISGNSKSITTPNDPLIKIELDDPFCGTESYQNDGLVNYFGAGYHNSVNFTKGRTETIDISSGYGNYQSGAFKLAADDGGNNKCPIFRVYQSPAAGVPTAIQINTAPTGISFTQHRENETTVRFDNIPGNIGNDPTYGLNYDASGLEFYVRHLDTDKLELYLDKAFTQPHDTSLATSGINPSSNAGATVSYGSGTLSMPSGSLTWPGNTGSVATGGFIISGYGDQLYFAIVAKPVGPSVAGTNYQTTHGDITIHFKLTWNEITQ